MARASVFENKDVTTVIIYGRRRASFTFYGDRMKRWYAAWRFMDSLRNSLTEILREEWNPEDLEYLKEI